jgi:hypothetical protein
MPHGNSLSGFFTIPSTDGMKFFLFREHTFTMYADTTKVRFKNIFQMKQGNIGVLQCI